MRCFGCGSNDCVAEININSDYVNVKCPDCERLSVLNWDSYKEMELVERIADRVIEKLNESRIMNGL